MYIKLENTFRVAETIRIAKENKLDVVFERDGVHGTDDLEIVLMFQEAGFKYTISRYKGSYEENAIRVEFHYVEK